MDTNNNEMLEQNNMEIENVVQEQNNVVQNVDNNYEQNNKRNFKALIIMLLVFVILALGVVFAFSMLKSDEEKFYDLLLKKQAVASLFEEVKNGQVDTEIEVDIAEIAETFGEEMEEDLKIGVDVSEVIKKDNASGAIEFLLNDDSLITLEYAKTDDTYGVKVKDATEKFIAIQNKDLQSLFEKFGVEDTEELPDKFLTQEDFEKVMKMKPSDTNSMANKYIKVLAQASQDAVKVEKNVELKIGNEKFKTKKYTLSVTEKTAFEIVKSMLETLKNDEKNISLFLNDIKAVLELMEENNYPVKDMYGVSSKDIPDVDDVTKEIEEMYEDILEDTEDYEFDDEEVVFEISVYEFKGETIATEIKVDDEKMIFKAFADKELYVGLVLEEDDEEIVEYALEGTINKDGFDAEFVIGGDGIKLEIFSIKQKRTNSTKNLVKLDDKNALIINDADEDELEEYAEEFMEGMEKIAEDLQEIFPTEDLIDSMGSITEVPSIGYDDYDYDFDYDYDYDDDLVEYTGVLVDAQAMYSKVQIGESKESVIQKLGSPATDYKYSTLEFIEWDSNIATNMSAIEVIVQDGIVREKSIVLYSSKYDGVLLGKETNATVENLENVISNVKEGMPLSEVEDILGKSNYESSADEDGYKTYTWCDKLEQTVDISFDDGGKAYYIGRIW